MTNRATTPTDWPCRLDRWATFCGAAVPAGLVIGNLGFEAMVALTALLWLVRCFLVRHNPLPFLLRHPLGLPWIAWYAVMVTSLAVNGPGSKGWAHDVVFVRYVLFGLALLDVSRRFPVARYLLWGLGAGVAWAAVNTVSAYALGHDLIGKPLVRYTGKLKEASRIAGLSAYAAPFFAAWAVGGDPLGRRRRWLLALLAAVSFAQVSQTHVRTAIGAAGVGALLVGAIFVWRRISVKTALIMAAGVAGMLVAITQLPHMQSLTSLYDRFYYWKVAWAMWLDHPVFGVGISSFQDAYKEMAASGRIAPVTALKGYVFHAGEQTHAHSLLFMLLACSGLAGVAAFGWLFVQAVRVIIRTPRGWRTGLAAWPAVLLTIGLTGFNIYHSWYQALIAFFLVLIGAEPVAEEEHGDG